MYLINYKKNYYDKLIIVIIILQLFGIYGGAFQPLRLFSLILFPYLVRIRVNSSIIYQYKYEQLFIKSLIFYGLIQLIFVYDKLLGIKEMTYIIVHSLIIANIILAASRANKPKESIIVGWLLLLIISIPFSLIEIFYDWHFSNSKIDTYSFVNIGGIGVRRIFSAFTFGNYNLYNVILIYSLPFLVSVFFLKNKKINVFFSAVLTIVVFILLTNGSRGAFLSIIVIIGIYLFFNVDKKWFSRIVIPIVFIVALTKLLFLKGSIYIELLTNKSERLYNDNTREALIYNGMKLLSGSYLFGVGPGNLPHMYRTHFGMDILAPHNLFLEILVQYGLLLFVGFLFIIIRIMKFSKNTHKQYKYIIYSSVFALPFSSIITSGYLCTTNLWVFIGSLMVISNSNFDFISNE